MVPRPVALGLTLCDHVIIEERTRKASLIGQFTGMPAESFPHLAQPFCLFAVLTNAIGSGTLELELTRLDTGEEIWNHQGPIEFPDRLAEVRFVFRLRQCYFPAPGKYDFVLKVDGDWVAQRSFRVYQLEAMP